MTAPEPPPPAPDACPPSPVPERLTPTTRVVVSLPSGAKVNGVVHQLCRCEAAVFVRPTAGGAWPETGSWFLEFDPTTGVGRRTATGCTLERLERAPAR